MFTLVDHLSEKLKLKCRYTCIIQCCIKVEDEDVITNEVSNMSSAANEVKQQLHMVHNPFSSATSQPKLPDGKVNKSLGFSTQSVEEISGTGEVEILLFPGLNAMAVIKGSNQATLGTRINYIPKFQGSNTVDWSAANLVTPTGFNVRSTDNYAMWRVVSAGMQLKLLNPVDEDDGWWEACRVTAELDNDDWNLFTVNNSADILNNGCFVPVGQLSTGINIVNIVNEPSYSTGLLRDLHRVQFELHTQKDFHDFIQMRDDVRIPTEAIEAVDGTNYYMSFNSGYPEVQDLIKQYTDQNMDMVYVKLHCNNVTGSRFHMNLVMNQEIVFDPSQRESRFQTRCHNIGAGAASIHLNARRADGNAAHMVTE